MSDSTFGRLRKYGFWRIIRSPDFISALVVSTVFTVATFYYYSNIFQPGQFITSATKLSRSLIAVVLTGIAILVSLSDSKFLAGLLQDENFDPIMVTFEYTAILSVVATITGTILQSMNFGIRGYAFFNWVFFYNVFAALSIISKIVTFGYKRARHAATEEVDESVGDKIVGVYGPDETIPPNQEDEE